jgi:hypothetical protein
MTLIFFSGKALKVRYPPMPVKRAGKCDQVRTMAKL